MFYIQNISIYMNFGGVRSGVHGRWGSWSTVHFWFIIQNNGKSTRAWSILKSNSTLFFFHFFFLGWIIKKKLKRGPQGAPLLFLYEVSIVVIINFIAILLTPGIFFIQIVNTNNTIMYLIHFIVKILLNCVFPKLGFNALNPLQTFIIHRYAVK